MSEVFVRYVGFIYRMNIFPICISDSRCCLYYCIERMNAIVDLLCVATA